MAKVLSWEGVSEKTVRQILSEAESFMAAQLQVALATDQRAITAASIFSAFSTAVVGAAIAYWAQSEDTPLVTALMVAGVLLTAAAFCCFWAARPINFYFPGNHPASWWNCRTSPLVPALGGEAENYQTRIEHNERCLQANARAFNRRMRLAGAAPLVAIVVWLLFLGATALSAGG